MDKDKIMNFFARRFGHKKLFVSGIIVALMGQIILQNNIGILDNIFIKIIGGIIAFIGLLAILVAADIKHKTYK